MNDTEFIIFVGYQPYSGGKLVINSLGLADNACLQHFLLAHQQLKNNFSQEDKKNYLIKKLSASTYFWDDLSLGCKEFFGVPNHLFNDLHIVQYQYRSKLVKACIDKKIHFFKVVQPQKYNEFLPKWPNGKIINFTNSLDITKKRLKPITKWFNDEDVLNVDVNSIHTLDNLNRVYKTWNCAWFDEKEKYLLEIENLYETFKLTNYNKEILSTIYDSYIKAWYTNIQYLNAYNEDF